MNTKSTTTSLTPRIRFNKTSIQEASTATTCWDSINKHSEKPTITLPPKDQPKQPVAKPSNHLVSDPELAALEDPENKVPGHDTDKVVMQLPPKGHKFGTLSTESFENPSLLSLLETDVEVIQDFTDPLPEDVSTPDYGMGVLGQAIFGGAALEPGNVYQRNFCQDPLAPEEFSPPNDQTPFSTLVAPKNFVPQGS